LSPFALAQSEDYFELYENYASADAMKYHEILQSIEAGDIPKAKEQLLLYQSAEIAALESLKEHRGIKPISESVVNKIREYNHQLQN
jgi:hypothetical protein